MIKEAPQETESCWTTAYSVRNCEGYHVFAGNAWLGYVDAVLIGSDDNVHSLLVKGGDVFMAVPVEAVVAIDPAGERVDLAERHEARSMVNQEVRR